MTFRLERGILSDGGLVAIGEFLARMKQIESADKIEVDVTLMRTGAEVSGPQDVMLWSRDEVIIPSLRHRGSVRPLFLLKAVAIGSEESWPAQAHLQFELEAPNRDLSYTNELLGIIRDFCVRGYTIGGSSHIRLEGRSLDLGRTSFFLELSIMDDQYIVAGIPPQPKMKRSPELYSHGW